MPIDLTLSFISLPWRPVWVYRSEANAGACIVLPKTLFDVLAINFTASPGMILGVTCYTVSKGSPLLTLLTIWDFLYSWEDSLSSGGERDITETFNGLGLFKWLDVLCSSYLELRGSCGMSGNCRRKSDVKVFGCSNCLLLSSNTIGSRADCALSLSDTPANIFDLFFFILSRKRLFICSSPGETRYSQES